MVDRLLQNIHVICTETINISALPKYAQPDGRFCKRGHCPALLRVFIITKVHLMGEILKEFISVETEAK
jgi:hypothetical protein